MEAEWKVNAAVWCARSLDGLHGAATSECNKQQFNTLKLKKNYQRRKINSATGNRERCGLRMFVSNEHLSGPSFTASYFIVHTSSYFL